ncbi:hypothetical protein [Lactobacillus sp.]|uniref:hypothetical protein n=1 Tax=Lactobacillus sp. TaxID=1591 RepID=UPI00198631FE|nr:hypothetical protein [Lactobacillus sp.]MBD5430792.1 hypothetical protein [Lactobacillus sp.]
MTKSLIGVILIAVAVGAICAVEAPALEVFEHTYTSKIAASIFATALIVVAGAFIVLHK